MTDKKIPVSYVSAAHAAFSLSEDALKLTPLAKLERLYEAVTFRKISAADRKRLNNALAKLSYDEVIDSFLSKWFNSSAYSSYYNYEDNPYIGKSWFRIKGTVQDSSGSALSGMSVKLQARDDTQPLASAASQSDGSYEILAELSNDTALRQVSLQLTGAGYVERSQAITLVGGEEEYTHNFQTIALGTAHPEYGGEIHSTGSAVKAYIPAGAVSSEKNFTVSSLEEYVMTEADPGLGQSEVKALRFTASPDQEFEKTVMLEITLDTSSRESLQVQEGDEDLALFVEEEDGSLRMLVPSTYDPETGKLTAPTAHFSTFVVSSCGATFCPVGGTSRLTPSQNASIFIEPDTLQFPKEIPAFRIELKEKLTASGWSETASTLDGLNTDEICPDQEEGALCTDLVIDNDEGASGTSLSEGYDFSEVFDVSDKIANTIGDSLQGIVGSAISGIIGDILGSITGSLYNCGLWQAQL